MNITTSVAGIVVVEIVSADIAGTLDLICKNQIRLWDILYQDQMTVQVRMYRHAWGKLQILLRKYGCTYRLLGKEGIYWSGRMLLMRPMLILGIVLFLVVVFYLPSRVLFVRVEGNSMLCSNQILEKASNLGIRFGASRRYVRSEQVKNGLLSSVEELEWVGVNTKGCIAIISVREHSKQSADIAAPDPGDIVAIRDGIVLKSDIIRGTGICVPGQAIKSGDILISGTVDHGDLVTFTTAEGEVFAFTQREISVVSPTKTLKRGLIQRQYIKYRLLIGKKLINFFKCSGISGSTCVKMYSKYVLTLPGGFELPLGLVQEIFIERELSEEILDEHEVRKLLSHFASDYIRNQMIAGRILGTDEQLALGDNVYQLSGNYACTEMIGRVQQDQIGAYHGKTD